MADVDYGTDIAALDDLPDPEQLASGPLNLAYALCRRLLTPDGAIAEIGDFAPYASLDLNDYLGKSMTPQELAALNAQVNQILKQDPRVDTVTAVVTFAVDNLSVVVNGVGAAGPFSFVFTIDEVSSTVLLQGA